jgi:hypothetical protein
LRISAGREHETEHNQGAARSDSKKSKHVSILWSSERER